MKNVLVFFLAVLSFTFPCRAFAYNPFMSDQAQASAATGASAQFGQSLEKTMAAQPSSPAEFEETRLVLKQEPETPSAFEDFLAKSSSGTAVKQFGYSLFRNQPTAFASAKNVPVTPDYIAGPGDEIIISVWGRIEGRWAVVVDRDGNISIPKIGIISVAGLSFGELKETVNKELSKSYSDYNLNVTFGSLHSIRIYVVGNARRPGAYTISSLSTLVNALFEAGGPDKNGSMREIQLKRSGKTVTTFDLYDLLLKGDKSKDSKLLNEDVVFIPPVGPMAAVSGQVKTPAIYELKEGTCLLDLITMAGGFDNTAFRGRVAMRRIFDHKFRDFLESGLGDLEKDPATNIVLQDGDSVSVFPIIEDDSAVQVAGAVPYPGKFGILQGRTTIKDIIKLAGGLMSYSSDQAELTRVALSSAGVITERFNINLTKALTGAELDNFTLKANDHIMVKPIPDWKLYKTVTLEGEFNHPGVYTVKKGELLSSVLERAGGFTDKAYTKGVVFTRESARRQQQQNLEEIAARLEKELFVESSVKMQTALSAEDVQGKQAEMEAKRKFIDSLKGLRARGRVQIKIATIKSLKNSDYDIELEDGDMITLPSRSGVVSAAGAVMSQGSFVYSGGNYTDYIDMAGGYADYANSGKTFILKADGSARKAKHFFFFKSRVEPGDTIVVPEKFDRIAWLREIRDFSQILMNVALTAGIVIKVF
ncbi:MAG: SLBB domain-containing protein [Elusimicrobia bacterium]|nr:SLBB domain-containing protein [Elusimicrobiota bacterium]